MRGSLFDDEQHGRHHHDNVMVSGSPAKRLIVRQAAFAFGIFEHSLGPEALSLHLVQAQNPGIGGGVGQAVLDRPFAPHLSPYG